MTKTKAIITFLPSLLMAAMTIVSFTSIFEASNLKGLFIIGLLIIFPLLFLSQGVACGLGKANFIVSIGLSIVTFFIIIMLFLNLSALIYIFLYLFVAAFGYALAYFTEKGRSSFSQNKE